MKKYKVFLWCGCGYVLDEFSAEAFSEEQASEIVVAELIKKGLTSYYMTESEYENFFEKELEENPEFESDQYIYIDATMEGAQFPVYLLIENVHIELAA